MQAYLFKVVVPLLTGYGVADRHGAKTSENREHCRYIWVEHSECARENHEAKSHDEVSKESHLLD